MTDHHQDDHQGHGKDRANNPWLEASLLSRLIYLWPYPLLKLGLERPLEERDLPDIAKVDTSSYNREYLTEIWEAEKNHNRSQKNKKDKNQKAPKLWKALLKDFFRSNWHIQPLFVLNTVAKLAQAIALGQLVQSFEDTTSNNNQGYIWAGVLAVCGGFILVQIHHQYFITWRKGMQLRISVIAAIYQKALRLSSTCPSAVSRGKIMNLASNDVERFFLACDMLTNLVWSPFQAMAILAVGWLILGPAFCSGMALLVLVIVPLQSYLGRRFAFYRSNVANITDRRVTFVSQAVAGARIMKMSGYEFRFLERIKEIRTREVTQISRANNLRAWNEAIYFGANVIISTVIFIVHLYVTEDGQLEAGDVFAVITLVNMMQFELTKFVSLGVMGVSEAFVSINRIQEFLESPELPQPAPKVESKHLDVAKGNVSLALSHTTSYWDHVEHIEKGKGSDEEEPSALALSDVSIEFAAGELTFIVGTVGSGKSALLQALVGELPVYSGSIHRQYNTIAYAPQNPWIMDGTVRENIILGITFDPKWYNEVVDACGLREDFSQLVAGDETIVGDRGVQCSGGQRARIGLARALYSNPDVLVADDPLSAVDSGVGRLMFDEAIQRLMVARGKCVILATHQHQYIGESRCVLMIKGRIECIGTYEECVELSGGHLTGQVTDTAVDNLGDDTGGVVSPPGKEQDRGNDDVETETAQKEGGIKEDGKEQNVQGAVRFDTYLNYARAMGSIWLAVFMLILFTATQACVLFCFAAMGKWAERPAENQKSFDIVGLIVGLCVSAVILALIRAKVFFVFTVKASKILHDRMTKAVLRAQIGFFDTNPSGRILNRFSADVGSNDELLPQTLFDFLFILFMVLGGIVTACAALPVVLVAVPPLLWYFVSVRRVFVTSTRELKRLEGLARSPIFAMLSEALSGVAAMRANNSLQFFQKKFEAIHDDHTRAFFPFIGSARWFGFRMDAIMYLFLVVASFVSVLFHEQEWFSVDATVLGLALSMIVQLAGVFQWCVRQSAEVVNQMVSVERVLAFGKLPPEAELECPSDSKLIQEQWPQDGQIDFREVSVRYRPTLPLALNKASFHIPRGVRVGVVGRTGSGKSTLMQTLFRLLEPEEGNIQIDGVDINGVGLHTLRTKISVIPQVPTLFSGCSVRENLDLFGIHSEAKLQEALVSARMSEAIKELPGGLDSMVSEDGTNFSVGQRQLLCLARAILNKNKILVLDEATASVDRRTDELLHEALKESFCDATIIAVAHRLDTVIESDFILVLGHAKVLEFASPAELIRSEGAFASMVKETGESMSRELHQMALQAEAKKVQ